MTAQPARAARRNAIWTQTHEPSGGMQRVLGPLYPTGIFWFRASSFFARWTPRPISLVYSVAATLLCWAVMPRLRRGITSNLNVVLGRTGFFGRQRRVLATYWMFAQITMDRYGMTVRPEKLQARFEGLDNWHAAMRGDRGCIIVSAHLGNWEVASLIPSMLEKHIHVVREAEIDRRSQAFVAKLYEKHQSTHFTVHFAGPDANLGPNLLFALRRGDVIGLSGDQPRTGQSFVEVTMFDRPTPIPHGPAALARAAEVPILPVFGVRVGPLDYRIIVREPFRVPRTADRERDVLEATQLLATHMEWAIRHFPHSWFCWWPRWPA